MFKRNWKTILFTALAVIILSLSITAVLLVSNNYAQITGAPPNEDAVIDFSGYSLDDVSGRQGAATAGKWEFFYNDWIVSDNVQREPDFLIDVPGRWTGKEIDGETLAKTGYASYRLTVLNLPAGTVLTVNKNIFPAAYKIFINDELISQSGVMSKQASGSFARGIQETETPYTVASSPLEIIVELSYNSYGGLISSPWLNSGGADTSGNLSKILTYLVTGMMAAFLMFCIILNAGFYNKRQHTFTLLIFSVFCHFMTTEEVFAAIGSIFSFINYAFIYEAGFITGAVVLCCFLFNALRLGIIKMNRYQLGVWVGLLAIGSVLYFMMTGTIYQIIPSFMGVLGCCYLFPFLFSSVRRGVKGVGPYIPMLLILAYTLPVEILSKTGYVIFGFEPAVSFMLLAIMLFVGMCSYLRIRRSAEDSIKALILSKENQQIKHTALKSQIKPHFVFNSLTSIQALYQKSIKDGDNALEKFARHLRMNIDSDKKDTIPFDEELKNIMNYFELENLRLEQKLILLIDINYTDFRVPILSLQPLIENAIKHSHVEEKEDGYIQIITDKTEEAIIIEIVDNGRGFDTEDIRENAAGLKNASERLKYLLNAEVIIDSNIGMGTKISIIIPKKSALAEESI